MTPLTLETQKALVEALHRLLVSTTTYEESIKFALERMDSINDARELLARARAEMGGEDV